MLPLRERTHDMSIRRFLRGLVALSGCLALPSHATAAPAVERYEGL
jgi:hypothetical protein